jgi:hypothetical protein
MSTEGALKKVDKEQSILSKKDSKLSTKMPNTDQSVYLLKEQQPMEDVS